jgi:thiamine-monophosphate kinase
VSDASLPLEDALILSLAGCLPPTRNTRLAIGDDAAAITLPDGNLLLVTTDMLMEDVHFRLSWDDLPALGWKALAQNLSDIAAMGGTPTHAVIAIALPAAWAPHNAQALYRGIATLAAQAEVDVIGGDTIRSAGPLTLTLTVLGRVSPNELLTRRGARPGDALYVTGTLGRAAAGLRVLEDGRPIPDDLAAAVDAQLRPQPRLVAARAIASSRLATAMMDLSDGLATDLHRLCRASSVGAVVDGDAVPVDPVVAACCRWAANAPGDPLALALTGGEDFELLIAAPPAAAAALHTLLAPLPLTRIGECTAAPEVQLRRGAQLAPLAWGFTHFT